MSKASASRTIKFIRKLGTYSATIMSPSGDLFQDYKGDANAPAAVFPDWDKIPAESKPRLNFIVTSSRKEELVKLSGVKYYFNDAVINFDSAGVSTGTMLGLFKRIIAGSGSPYDGIQILKNLVVASAGSSCVIKMEGHVGDEVDGGDIISATYNIPIQPAKSDSLRCTIVDTSGNSFVLRDAVGLDSCSLKAVVYKESTEIDPQKEQMTFEWYKMSGGNWVSLNKATQSLVVTRGDVDTYGDFMVKVKLDKGATEVTDAQSVLDASDPYDIEPNASPADETIIEGDPNKRKVNYRPKIVKRSGGILAVQPKFFFTVRDAAGNLLNIGSNTVPKTEFDVTIDMANQTTGDMSLVIESDNINA